MKPRRLLMLPGDRVLAVNVALPVQAGDVERAAVVGFSGVIQRVDEVQAELEDQQRPVRSPADDRLAAARVQVVDTAEICCW